MVHNLFGTKRHGRVLTLILIALAGALMLTVVARTHVLIGEIEKSVEQQTVQNSTTVGE